MDKIFSLLLTFFLFSPALLGEDKAIPFKGKKITVRLTVYWSHGGKSDKWTRQGKSSTGIPLKEGHIAVDPKIIPYGSSVLILGKKYRAVDTGSSVVKRTASRKMGRNEPVIDIYFKNKKDALEFSRKNPKIVTVLVKK